ncbi:hypothetical protein KKF05_05425 [Patescibacteria group bacterium]|nr:hypothetical protein [Patescibacteria group bacterium]
MDEFNSAKHFINSLPLLKTKWAGFLGRKAWPLAAGLAVLCVFVLPLGVEATVGSTTALALAAVFHLLVGWIGQLLLLLTGALIYVAQYNGFVDSDAVTNGWVIVRDIANMFFIVSLLLIAFGTMLGFGSYHYSSTLPRLVIMAVLVNFSRTICGLLIDFAQVIMLTFVNGFKEAAGGNFVNAFQISTLMQLPAANDSEAEDVLWKTAISMILAFFLISIASGVVVIMIVVLVTRIVYLWLLIVLSPLAFLASTVPITRASGFYGKWWDKFNNQLIVGPLMAFFLWLALVSVSSDRVHTKGFPDKSKDTSSAEVSSAAADAALREGNVNIEKFIISIALLLGGVAMAQEMSQGAVGLGKNVLNRAGRVGVGALKLGAKGGRAMAGGVYKATGGEALVDRTKERLYTGLGRLPGGGYWRRKAAGQRGVIEQKAAIDSKLVSQMNDKELEKEARRPALSHAARAAKKAALQEQLKRAADPANEYNMDEKTYHAKRREGQRLDKMTNSTEMETAFSDFAKKNTRFIVDPQSTGKEREKQLNWFKASWKGKSAHGIGEMNAKDYTPEAMTLASSQALATAHGTRMNADQQRAMFSALGMDDKAKKEFEGMQLNDPGRAQMIEDHQERLRQDPKNFEYLDNDQKAKLVHDNAADPQKIASIGVDRLASVKVDDKSMNQGQREQVARDLGQALSAEDIRKLPQDLAEAIRSELKNLSLGSTDGGEIDKQLGKYLESGGTAHTAFAGYNAGTGNFDDTAGREAFGRWLERGNTAEKAGKLASISPYEMKHSAGANDLNIEIASNAKAEDIRQLLGAGNHQQAQAIIDMINNMEGMDINVAVESYESSLPTDLSSDQMRSKVEGFKARLEVAKKDATKIMNDLSDGRDSIAELLSAAKAQAKLDRAGDKLERKLSRKRK